MWRWLTIVLVPHLLIAHGFHSSEMYLGEGLPSVEVKELSSVLAVKRAFPLDGGLCAKFYDAFQGYCFVEFVTSLISHHDYSFPIPPVTLSNGDRITVDTGARGYALYYWGSLTTKEEQLDQIEEAIRIWAAKGIREAVTQLYRPSDPVPLQVYPFKEIKIGKIVGVKRRVSVRYNECAGNFSGDQCWVHILDESVPDHPGPEGGGNVSKEYRFSDTERVLFSLENLYSDYLIYYEGPETTESQVLSKIKTAIEKLKGNSKELYLESFVFTLKRNRPLPGDTVVASANFFEIEMPLTFELCMNSLDPSNQSCKATFSGSVSPGTLDHPGGGEVVIKDLGVEGTMDIYGTYVAGNPFWKLHYERTSTSTLNEVEFLKTGFAQISNKIRSYGFHAN